ncbi:hypothetical protein D3C84_515490 [compost metagenome]
MGQAFAEAGADLEVVSRYVVEADQASLLRDLADNAFATVDLLVKRLLLPGETIGGHALETAVFFTDINSGHRRPEVLRAKLQNVAPEHIERQLPQHLFGQFGLAVAQPGLLFQATGAGLLRGEVGTVAL